ncbi:NnrS family protein [Prosthecobacter sp.]|uniref:NnrS family protein n=1 Tax=Prosthecobacter sp. TaxID=1965333 RepID=UPI001D1BCE63|nr:NnrS family protein [Prosthecobacter sp.]MCB1275318.1 NnrS family protein [Prosthecobacter sp.]
MSAFPACKHKKHKARGPRKHGLRWLASEPYRVFFASGAMWSIIGVSLWPLLYAQLIGFNPNFVHARIMIEAFGGAFVVGFLGTAGPRMATAPKLTSLELLWLFALHQACGISHLTLHLAWGDAFFVALLVSLMLCLVIRVIRFRKEAPPPQMLLALTGLACGIAGAAMQLSRATLMDPQRLRLANLLLYQGLLLPPVLGIGSFVFPRMLGGDFGDPKTAAQSRAKLVRSIIAAMLLVSSFFLEAFGMVTLGYAVRAIVAAGYLLIEVTWKTQQSGSLATGLSWALIIGWLGIVLAPFYYAQHVSIEHLIYIGGFGMLMLIVGSRVLFGHSGDLEGFFVKSKWVRFLIFLGVLAATTRATPAWVPSTTVSHHIYAAWTWGLLSLFWLLWHRQRFMKRDEE